MQPPSPSVHSPSISHAIRLPELSAFATNVAIPTTLFQCFKGVHGNCMQHLWGTITTPNRPVHKTRPTTRSHSASDPLQRLPPHRDLSDDQHAISVHNVPSSPSLTPQPPHRTTLHSNRSPLRPKHPISDTFCRSGLHFEQPAGGCNHRSPTRRRHVTKRLLWSQFPPNRPRRRAATPQEVDDGMLKTTETRDMPHIGSTTPVREHYTTSQPVQYPPQWCHTI